MKSKLTSLVVLLLPFWAQAQADFLIKPYLFTIKGQDVALAWQYKSEPSTKPEVSLYQGRMLLQKSRAESHGSQWFFSLPPETCGFGDSLSYQVTGMSEPITIENIPCPYLPDTIRFSFLADTQEGYDAIKRFADLLKPFKRAALIYGGDLVQNGSHPDEWVHFFNALEEINGRQMMIPVVGNHEYRHEADVPAWNEFFQTPAKEAFYSVWLGTVHIIVLNSCFFNDPTLPVRELPWLEKELALPASWTIVSFHHPPYSESVFHTGFYPKREYVTLQEDFVPLFEKYKVDLVLNGHTHIFEHDFKNGVHYLITGPAGGHMGFYGNQKNSYSLKSEKSRTMIQIEASVLSMRVVTTTIDGRVLDDFSLSKLNSADVNQPNL